MKKIIEMKEDKNLVVSAIENGTVIDHIPSSSVFQVMKILGLDSSKSMVLFGINLDSQKFGKKGLIKIENQFFEPSQMNKIGLVAPTATIIEIKNGQKSRKFSVEIPDKVNGIVKCFNPKCITNHEEIETKFDVIDKTDIKLLCHYCEKITKRETLSFK